MAVLNPHHLLEQARALVRLYPGRKPRQVELRRAISAAYYAVFHRISNAVADEFIGGKFRNDPRHASFYRSVDHKQAKTRCEEVTNQNPASKYARYSHCRPLAQDIKTFANAFPLLQSKRHEADYDPSITLTTIEAVSVIDHAERAIAAFDAAPAEDRKLFLTYLIFPPR